jgi:trk system potassium uptake protein TrkA
MNFRKKGHSLVKKTFGNRKSVRNVAVFGLGRFGGALAKELVASGVEVLGIETDESRVQQHNGLLTKVVRVDPGVGEALEQLHVKDFDVCVIAIGSDVLASILIAAYLTKIGAKEVWAKATSVEHGEILGQIGVHHIVYPEHDMGRRVAHQVKGSTDFIEVDDTYVIIKTTANQHIIGTRLGDSEIRKRYGVTVMAVKRGKGNWVNADSDTIVAEHDEVLVAGPTKEAEQFGLLN